MRDAYGPTVLVQLCISGLASAEDEAIHTIGMRDLAVRRPGKLKTDPRGATMPLHSTQISIARIMMFTRGQ